MPGGFILYWIIGLAIVGAVVGMICLARHNAIGIDRRWRSQTAAQNEIERLAEAHEPHLTASVRGIVAAVLGYSYTGFELRPEQVAANRAQAADICPDAPPHWITGDSAETVPAWAGLADFVFSCPPYGDLEVYSDKAADLSAMPHSAFLDAYRAIIATSVAKLRPNRFAAFVVGDFRCKKGFYRNFVGETVSAFEAAGARFYNEAILVTAVGSLPVRVGKQFKAGRKLGKTHQNMLVFCKGDPRAATQAIECRPVTEAAA